MRVTFIVCVVCDCVINGNRLKRRMDDKETAGEILKRMDINHLLSLFRKAYCTK